MAPSYSPPCYTIGWLLIFRPRLIAYVLHPSHCVSYIDFTALEQRTHIYTYFISTGIYIACSLLKKLALQMLNKFKKITR